MMLNLQNTANSQQQPAPTDPGTANPVDGNAATTHSTLTAVAESLATIIKARFDQIETSLNKLHTKQQDVLARLSRIEQQMLELLTPQSTPADPEAK